jgi:hypothetical protein
LAIVCSSAQSLDRSIAFSFSVLSLLATTTGWWVFEPNNHTVSSRIHLRHGPDLATPFFIVVLVDADSICPDDPVKEFMSKVFERRM